MKLPVIYRGTTPVHRFSLPMSASSIAAIQISYAQNGSTVLTKVKTDCTFSGQTASVMLGQEETLLFSESGVISIQVRLRDSSGKAYASAVIYALPGKILTGGTI